MKYWIVPCKDSIFLFEKALEENKGFVDWRQSYDFAVGDIVFIYKILPEKEIRYRMEVVATGLAFDESTDKELFWKDQSLFYDNLGSHQYVRFQLQQEFPHGFFMLKSLREHGLKGNMQSVIQVRDERLLAFLKGETTNIDIDDDVAAATSVGEYKEGELYEVVCNQYERNRKAREACIALKGYRCAVCGMDFESLYGEIGRGFIHVHHLVPISSIGESYDVNPATDLVPVCPNCHNMLHKKEPPYTIEELKEMLT